jgi:hypothetical protein
VASFGRAGASFGETVGNFFNQQIGQRISNLFNVGSLRNDMEYIAHQAEISGERGRIDAKAALGYPLNDKENFMQKFYAAIEQGADTAWGGDDIPKDVANNLMMQNNPEAMHNEMLKQYVDNGKTKTEQWVKGLGLSPQKEKAMLDGVTAMREKWKSGRDEQLKLIQQRETLRMIAKDDTEDMQNRVKEGDDYWKKEAQRNYNTENKTTMVDGVLLDLDSGGIDKLAGLSPILIRNLVRGASLSNVENFTVGSAVRHPTKGNPEITHRLQKGETLGKSVDITMMKFFDNDRVAYRRTDAIGQRSNFEAFEDNFIRQKDSIAAWTPFSMHFSGQGEISGLIDSYFTRPANFPYRTGLDAPQGSGAIQIFRDQGERIGDTGTEMYKKYKSVYNNDRNVTDFLSGSAQHWHHGHFTVR